MIEITLEELDLELEVTQTPEYELNLDGSAGNLAIQGPIDFGMPVSEGMQNHGYIDLDLIGFPYYGLSAYEIALKHGFIGTEEEWLASLQGVDGELGQNGKDGVAAAIEASEAAAGSASAAAGFNSEAEAWANESGQYARASQELYTQAQVLNEQTGEYASATATIFQQSEAILTATTAEATATQQARVAAETARANAEASETRTAHSMTSAEASAASASENAVMAVEARNQADDKAAAAVISSSEASTYADAARVDANASHQSQLIATAARDETNLIAQGVVIQVDSAEAWATEAEAQATAAHTERVAAEVAMTNSQNYAAAAYTSEQNAQAYADTSGNIYSALASRVDTVEVDVGNANASASEALSASIDAQGKVNSIWGVNLNANNRIVGLKYANDGTTVTFDIEADYFRVWDGVSAVPMFEVHDNKIYVAGNQVRTESIVPGSVIPTIYAFDATTQYGTGGSFIAFEQVVDIPYNCTIDVTAGLSMRFTSGDKNHNIQLLIDGVSVFPVGGARSTNAYSIPGQLAVDANPAGSPVKQILVQLLFLGQDNTVRIVEKNFSIRRIQR